MEVLTMVTSGIGIMAVSVVVGALVKHLFLDHKNLENKLEEIHRDVRLLKKEKD